MRRPILIALFALGTIGGYASGIHHLRYGGCHWSDRRAEYEQHIADLCTRAALDAQASRAAQAAPAQPPATSQSAPVQVAPVVIVPPVQMIAPQMVSAPAQAVPAPVQSAPAPVAQPGR